MHDNSMRLCREFADGLFVHRGSARLAIADIGSYDVNGIYRPLFDRPNWKYLGFDIRPGPNVDVVLPSPHCWKELDAVHREAFDVVISGQCMEHTSHPWKWIVDVATLIKPGGLLWLAVPNTEVFHEHPIDAWRVWPAGMSALLLEAGLEELRSFAEGPDTIGIARKPCVT